MKTSTKLILIYSGLIVAGVLSLYVSSHVLKDKKTYSNWADFKQYTVQVPDFSVVVIQDSTGCQLTVGDSSRIQWRQPRDSTRKSPLATVKNDTLFVAHAATKKDCEIQIMTKHVRSVVVKSGATVRLLEPMQNQLYVQVENGSCYLEPTTNKKKAEMLRKTLHLTVNANGKSYVELNSWFDTLTATLDSSRLQVNSDSYIRYVDLKQKHGSSSFLNSCPAQLTMQKDTTSTFQLY